MYIEHFDKENHCVISWGAKTVTINGEGIFVNGEKIYDYFDGVRKKSTK